MKKVLIINAHEPYPFAPGKLNGALAERARAYLESQGYEIRLTAVIDEIDVEVEIEKHVWADVILFQTPIYWMGVSAACKRYMDTVYSAGMDGRLCDGDGRTRKDPSKQYGSGGSLVGRRYMISTTSNAPRAAFGDPEQVFFEGRTIDDLFWPMHLNFRFFGMTALPTFSCYDVLKNPDMEADFERFDAHLCAHFPGARS